jgi:hypothetical protein
LIEKWSTYISQKEKRMKINRKPLIVMAVVISLAAAAVVFFARSGSKAVAQGGFNNSYLRGEYAFITAGGSTSEATIGVLVADGAGNITSGSLRLNLPPGAVGNPERVSVPATVVSGTYTINADGTGRSDAVAQIPGSTLVRTYDTVITEVDGDVAEELQMVQRQNTTAGNLGYFALKRIR